MNRYNTFLGFDSSYEVAKKVFLGIPFDGTVSFRPGTRFAPDAVRYYSVGLENYSPYQDKDIAREMIHDIGNIEIPFGNTAKTLQLIENKADSIINADKKLISCGGEHLIAYPLIKSHYKKYPDLRVIHIDAHTDLRDSYLGEPNSHASVIKIVSKFIQPQNIYQFGIRSGEKEEFVWARKNTNFFPFKVNKIKDISISKSTPIYITLDLDVLDPAYMPGTGTPEPGGVTFNELLNALLSLKDHNIVGADIVELSPDYDSSGASTMVAAKLIREIILMIN